MRGRQHRAARSSGTAALPARRAAALAGGASLLAALAVLGHAAAQSGDAPPPPGSPGNDPTAQAEPGLSPAPGERPAAGGGGGEAEAGGSDEPAELPYPLPADLPGLGGGAMPLPGERSTPSELEAWQLADQRKFIEAREAAENILGREPSSYVAELVLGVVQHYGEGNFPRALFHLDRAMDKYQAFHGVEPDPDDPWRWHVRLLQELAAVHGDLENHEKKLRYLSRHDELYDPDMLAERAWPLMKLRRFGEARAAAELGLAEDRPIQTILGLNALCAIEFEAGNDGASYDACKRAVDHAREFQGRPSVVDLTNFAEASRSLFKLDEAERLLLEATEASVSWYGNPWLELGTLYLRAARFPEALNALRKVKSYRARRPPHVQDADFNEIRRELAAFFLAVGRADAALRITERALVLPDRRGYNSRDPAQDEALVALIDRRARLVAAERRSEEASARPWWTWPGAWLEGQKLRFEAWMSGRRAARLLADPERLIGTFRIGTSKSAIMPPWLAGELVDVLGAGVVEAAVARARGRDERPGADAYYDAFEAEAALARGGTEEAIRLARSARGALGPGENMLGARMDAVIAAATLRQGGDPEDAARAFEAAWATDPGVLRRLDLAVPVSIAWSGGELARRTADLLAWSPRLRPVDQGLTVRIDANGLGGRACVLGQSGAVLACGEAEAEAEEATSAIAEKLADAFHTQVFAPKVDLTQADVTGLDGMTTSGDGAIDQLLGEMPD